MTTAQYDRGALRGADLLGLSLSALRQQKLRTFLTVVGVVIGTLALVLSVSIGRGVDRAIVAPFLEDDRFRRVNLFEKFELPEVAVSAEAREPKGSMSDAKRRRVSQSLVRTATRTHTHVPLAHLDAKGIERLRTLDHVMKVEPFINLGVKASLDGEGQDATVASNNSAVDFLRDRLVAGRLCTPEDGQTAVVHEYLLYRLGMAGDDVQAVLGRTIRLEFRSGSRKKLDLGVEMGLGYKEAQVFASAQKRMATLLPSLPIPPDERTVLLKLFEPSDTVPPSAKEPRMYSTEFTIVGVIREAEEAEKPGVLFNANVQSADIVLPPDAAEAFVLRDPENAEVGFHTVVVTVDHADHVNEFISRINSMGYGGYSAGTFIDTIRQNVRTVTLALAFVAFVALLVASVGITNTMIMSVLERTHEIGVMKALGARDRHIQLIFVVEGVVIGAVGSSLGLALSWLASFPGDSIAKSIIEPQTKNPMKDTLFVFPTWLVVGAPLLVCLITMLAALYPAYRAARVDPVRSLRHE
jgi:putative ABC transport system permease protein